MSTESAKMSKREKDLSQALNTYLSPYFELNDLHETEATTIDRFNEWKKNGGDIGPIVAGQLDRIHGVDFDFKAENWPSYQPEHELQQAYFKYEAAAIAKNFKPQKLVKADGLMTLATAVERWMKKGYRMVPGSAQCVDRNNAYGWWAVMDPPDKD